jgi:hypothetical protein
VERRQLTDRSVDPIGLLIVRIVEERHIDFHGSGRLERQDVLGDRAEDRLASDDQDVRVAGDLACRPEDMFELLAPHAA